MKMFREVLVIAVLAGPCLARVITVPADYSNIQAAINSAVNGDTVLIQPGTYTGTGNCDISFLWQGYYCDQHDPNDSTIIAATVVDCGGIAAGSHRGFIFQYGEGADSVLRGITVANAYVYNKDGGGLFCSVSSPTLDKCVFRNNKADMSNSSYGYGGGFYVESSSPTFTDCVFRGNTAYYRGGGGSSQGANPSFIRCVFQDNDAIEGGAFSAYIGKLTFNNCTFVGNGGNGHATITALDFQAVRFSFCCALLSVYRQQWFRYCDERRRKFAHLRHLYICW